MKKAPVWDILKQGAHQTEVLGRSGIDFHSFGNEGGWRFGGRAGKWSWKARQSRETGEATRQSWGLASCQLDSLTPFRGEQTNRGISQADSVDPS